MLISGEHIIFIGSLDTGKSKLGKHVEESVCDPDEYAMVTATANWSTFDTVEGYHPNRESHLEFILGTFLAWCQDEDDMPANEWLTIDQINRANVDKAFGNPGSPQIRNELFDSSMLSIATQELTQRKLWEAKQ